MSGRTVTLQEASERLGLHYMTVYRHIRTGRLAAVKSGSTWEIEEAELRRFARDARRGSPGRRGHPAHEARVPDLAACLVAGDEPGAWVLTEAALASGAEPPTVYLDLFVPAMRLIGDRWERGELGVADEHRATAVMQRLIGRMGPRFRRRGRSRGTIVVGAPDGELHALPTALVADLLRAEGFDVIDLGASVPAESFVECAALAPSLRAVAIAVTTPGQQREVRKLVRGLRWAGIGVPVLVGGGGIAQEEALDAGADHWARHGGDVVRALTG